MRIVWTLARKDLRILLRNRADLFFVLGFPLLLAVLFGIMFSGHSRGAAPALSVHVVDLDVSDLSRELIAALEKSSALKVLPPPGPPPGVDRDIDDPVDDAAVSVRKGHAVAYVVIPNGFELQAGLFGNETVGFEIGVDPSRRAEAGALQGVLMEAIHALLMRHSNNPRELAQQLEGLQMGLRFNEQMDPAGRARTEKFLDQAVTFLNDVPEEGMKSSMGREVATVQWTEVTRDAHLTAAPFEITFPSGMIWCLIGCVATFAMSVARERSTRTFLRLRIAPVSAWHVLAGKGLACLLACMAAMSLLGVVGVAVFDIRMHDPLAFFAVMLCCALCFVGIMSGISMLARSEQAVAGATWSTMLLMAMLGGGMMPIYFMPAWMRTASRVSPVRWGIEALEGSLWRGYSWSELTLPCAVLVSVGLAGFCFGMWRLHTQPVE